MLKSTWWAPLTVIAVLVAGCSGGDDADPAGDDVAVVEGEEAGADATGAAFPVTVGTGESAVEIPAEPQRIVSLSPTATEMLFAIGAGDRVVAADEYSNYPDEAPTTDLSGFTPNVEAISSYDPDLVVASSDPGELASSLAQVGIPTIIHPSAVTLDDTYQQIEQLGVATGEVAGAAAVVAQMQTDLAAIVDGLPVRDEPLTYFHELDPTYYSVTTETFIGQLYDLLGMRSIADDAEDQSGGYPQLSPEFIVQSDPDVILLADAACCGVDAAEVAARPGWDQLTAVQVGSIVELDEDLASRWGPRVVEFLDTVAAEVAALEPAR